MAIAIVDPSDRETGRARTILFVFGLATLLVHLLTNNRYGYFRDELYYLACGQHLAFGYVDHAPLSILLIRLSRMLFGESLFGIRLLPAFAGAGTIMLSGMIARDLGGRAWAVALACLAALTAPVFLVNHNFFSMNAFEPLFWMGSVWLLVQIINGGPTHLWLWFGLLIGLGIEKKHSTVFFGTAVVLALLLTPERRHFREKWIWLGGLIAMLTALPNIIWQVQHHWPTWELLSNVARSNKNVVLGPVDFIAQQILIMNPGTLPLWVGGLIWLLASRDGGKHRALAIVYLVALAEFILLHGKVYYLAPAYPMLFAAGGVAVERCFATKWRWVKPALAALVIIPSSILLPVALPILSPEKLVAYMQAIHFQPPRTETSHIAALPQHFADEMGWEEMVGSVARVYQQLSQEDQKRTAIFCQNYGQAGAIDFFGAKLGLPPALSGHQNYFLWGPRGYTGDVMLVLDDDSDDEREQFEEVKDMGKVASHPLAMPWEQREHIYFCRKLKAGLPALWPRLKKWL